MLSWCLFSVEAVLLPGRAADNRLLHPRSPLCWLWIGPNGERPPRSPARTPFLLSPNFDYDVALNSYFRSGDMLCLAWNTQDGYARDLKAFLNFLCTTGTAPVGGTPPPPTTWPT